MTAKRSAIEQSICIIKLPVCVCFLTSWIRFPVILGALRPLSAYDNQTVCLIMVRKSRKIEGFFLCFPPRSVITHKHNTSVDNTTFYFIYNKNSILSGRHVSTFMTSYSGPLWICFLCTQYTAGFQNYSPRKYALSSQLVISYLAQLFLQGRNLG